jgi:hypothetical protein
VKFFETFAFNNWRVHKLVLMNRVILICISFLPSGHLRQGSGSGPWLLKLKKVVQNLSFAGSGSSDSDKNRPDLHQCFVTLIGHKPLHRRPLRNAFAKMKSNICKALQKTLKAIALLLIMPYMPSSGSNKL